MWGGACWLDRSEARGGRGARAEQPQPNGDDDDASDDAASLGALLAASAAAGSNATVLGREVKDAKTNDVYEQMKRQRCRCEREDAKRLRGGARMRMDEGCLCAGDERCKKTCAG